VDERKREELEQMAAQFDLKISAALNQVFGRMPPCQDEDEQAHRASCAITPLLHTAAAVAVGAPDDGRIG
jgi:hypothetical protein